MSFEADLKSICELIRNDYTVCDVSDALLKLKSPGAGFLPNFEALLHTNASRARIVAPLSTVLFAAKSQLEDPERQNELPCHTNIQKGVNWTDCPDPGNIVLAQQPMGEFDVALLGDIMATRLHARGILGVIVDGRVRDVNSCGSIRAKTKFQVWSKGVSAVGPSLELKPWAVDVSLDFDQFRVQPGDIICADEEEICVCIIPKDYLSRVVALLPTLKAASDNVLEEVRRGSSLPEAVTRHPDFYSNYK